MKNLIQSAKLAFTLTLILNASAGRAQLVVPSINYGITTYSYVNEGVLGTNLSNVFF
jgi:hypothetical protein